MSVKSTFKKLKTKLRGKAAIKKTKPISGRKARKLYYSGQMDEAQAAYEKMVENFLNGDSKQLPKIAAVRTGRDFWNLRFSHKHKIAYLLIPKNACTSISHTMYKIETGDDFTMVNGRHIHDYYHPQGVFLSFDGIEDYYKFVIVRDPIKRFISAFKNRVHHHYDLEQMEAPRDDLPRTPDINFFVENLTEYLARSQSLEMHVMPQSVLFNRKLDQLDDVYRIEDSLQLAQKLSEITGDTIEFPRDQTGGPQIKLADLTPASFEKLMVFYQEDYTQLSDYYTETAIREEFETATACLAETK